jgi:hypothetical protein
MLNFKKRGRARPVALLTLLLSASLVALALSLTPAIAKQLVKIQPLAITDSLRIPAGTAIPVKYEKAAKILLTQEETFALSLTVTDSLKTADGQVLIADGSQIIGEIKPSSRGSQFFSQKIFLKQDKPQEESIDAISGVVDRLEKIIKGIDPAQIIKGAALGPSAAAVLASLTEDKPIDRGLLREGGLEVLAGWLLRGESVNLLSIDPQRDLQLTLRSDFTRK